ncbi:glycoside hydrolase family 24 protein [Amanita thiersii Skay4041]|uniref:Glycoside hydrolase family 24 protein n=1 Tax=Amanita thiersii Skay4041 TaxID=703135 RepID=A0A2A9NAZ2_9AGAR|nr:glycoside hydrolase family 24 protein [Amanita thiersii Skay4041]
MLSSLLITVLALTSTVVQGALNGPCSVNGTPGVCVKTAACRAAGGKPDPSNFCPNDPADVQCCTKPSCKSGGSCKWSNQCSSGRFEVGDCPGPAGFKCCLPGSGGGAPPPPSCGPPPVNQASLNLIKDFEKFVDSPYLDATGHPTVGYGHLCSTRHCTELGIKYPMTEKQGQDLLQRDLRTFTKCVSADINDKVRLNANQYGALVSWAFNVGCGNVKTSTLVSRLNKGENPNKVAASELPQWTRSSGHVLPGLVRRRKEEVKLFQTPSNEIAHPPEC